MKVRGFVIEFIISAVLVFVVFGAAADEEASFAYHSCFIIFAHNLDGKLSLPDSVPNIHSCLTNMVWWRYLKQLSTCFNCHRPAILMLTHTQASKGVLGSPPLAIGLAITTCHLFAVNIDIVILDLSVKVSVNLSPSPFLLLLMVKPNKDKSP